ncbi:hypothetical protein BOTBODRAFT_53335 [Botryobasidium botryosum FD-172 SS1]|uniref:Ribosome biogenesis protein ERB1 n=1 Tax=Botryobasidium botryosum (strain FD-172 SS1) TaxID=930990 RepID=A0A067N044_BOTB1|nr:hypothetical protein BOTBODRAFT_53335 [Botryobasidium botryosum FD-172 SS1]
MPAAASKDRKKRKLQVDNVSDVEEDLGQLGLDMASEDEQEGSADEQESSDGEEDVFPELKSESDTDDTSEAEDDDEDSEEEKEGEDDEEDEDDEDEEDEDERPFANAADDATLRRGLAPHAKTVISDITGAPKRVFPPIEPDYDSDSSTEETPNRVGNVPMHWYDDLPHVGYDIDGKKVLRPAKGDELDKFLSTVEDPSAWTSGFDKNLQADSQLTPEELDLIRRLHAAEIPDAEYDPYEPTIEWFTGKGKEEIMPLSAKPEPKRRWVPSKWEKQKVMKIVRAIRQGRIIPNKPKTTKPQFYALWATPSSDHPPPLPAPKPRLPTNAESYNPPAEYLPTPEEKAQWEEAEKEDRERDFLPQKYSSLRLVPGYQNFIQERFSRLLDLYLAPRIQRKRLNIDPDSLIPSLPSPQSLKPFPIFEAHRYEGTHRARCVSASPDGAWVVSGDEDGVVRVWETAVGREAMRWKFESKIGSVAWCPRTDVSFIAVGVDEAIHIVVPPYLSPSLLSATLSLLNPTNLPPPSTSATTLKWTSPMSYSPESTTPITTIILPPSSGLPKQLAFHRRGDYLSSVGSTDGQGAIWIHQISKRHSQSPFKKIKGSVQRVLFHPVKPHFFVATQRYVRIYDLAAQKLLKTLLPGIRWISSLDVHPSGDHLIVGGYDRKLCWFDLELSDKPYKVMRYHSRAIRSLHFHPTYPLFASSSDDGTIQVFHARVYNDLLTDPLIVPLKVLRGHHIKEGLGVLEIKWCTNQPWLVSAGSDGSLRVWCN